MYKEFAARIGNSRKLRKREKTRIRVERFRQKMAATEKNKDSKAARKVRGSRRPKPRSVKRRKRRGVDVAALGQSKQKKSVKTLEGEGEKISEAKNFQLL